MVRNQEPNVSQNLQAWVVVLAKTLQHDKTAITKYSNYFQETREEWLRYDWGRTECASVLLHAQRVWSHPNIRDLLIRGWRRQRKCRLKRKSPLRLFELTFLPNVCELSWSWISKTKCERKFCCGLFTSSIKSEIRHFHVILVQWRLKKCYKNVCCSRGAVVVHIRPISSLMFSLTSPSDLKVPILTRLSRGTKLKLFFFVVVFGLKQSVITLTNGWVHKDELIRPGAYLAEGNSCLRRWCCLTLRNIYDGIVTINQQFSKLWYFILPLIV